MIYLFHGNNFSHKHAQVEKFLETIFEKKPDATRTQIDTDSFSEGICNEFLVSRGMFTEEIVVVLRGVFYEKEHKEYFEKNLKNFADSNNIFIFIENELTKKNVDLFKKYAKRLWEFKKETPEEKRYSALFPLSDALGRRDRKKAWILFHKAISENLTPENIHGVLVWQVKNMLFIKNGGENIPLKPFVLRKSQSFSKNYSKDELKKLSSHLVDLYHGVRIGKGDLSIGIEKFLLTI